MSDLIYNFAQSSHPGRLTQLGQMGAQVYNQFQAKKAEQERTAQYNSLLRQFNDTQDLSLIPQLQNIAPEKFEGMQKAWSMMDQIGKERQAQTFGEVLRMVKTGSTDTAQARLEELAGAHEANGEQASADQYRKMIQQLESGDSNSVASYLTMALGQDDVGRGVLGAMQSIDQEERAEIATQGQIFEMAQNNPYMSATEKQRFTDAVDGVRYPYLQVISNLAGVASMLPGGLTVDQKFNFEKDIRDEYDDYVGDYMTAVRGSEGIAALAAMETGFADQGMIMYFNKVLDPPSVVRESEAKMTADNQSLVNKARTTLENLKAGDRLSPTARQELVDAAAILGDLAAEREAEERDRLSNVINEYGLSRDNIFFSDEIMNPWNKGSRDLLNVKAKMVSIGRNAGFSENDIERIMLVKDMDELKSIGDGSLYNEAMGQGTAGVPAATETAPVQDNPDKQAFLDALQASGMAEDVLNDIRGLSFEEATSKYQTLYGKYQDGLLGAPKAPLNIPDDDINWG